MIERYNVPEISSIWSLENKYRLFMEVELAILKAQEGGRVPAGLSDKIRKSVKVDVSRIAQIEETTKHDVIAFCSSITEQLSPEDGRFFHFGVTSSDIIDTATSLQLKQSYHYVLKELEQVTNSLMVRAQETKEVIALGRSHGMNAEPMSFGQKILGHYAEFKRRFNDYKELEKKEFTGQFSGAVGNYTILSPQIEKEALTSLNLAVEDVSTQVIPRDRLAKIIQLHALIACAIERFAVEERHLHHSDIGELHEGFSKGQKGSSIMPHKKNPISGENLTGLARVLRSHASIALDDTVLWHERDISHSSAERLYLPDNFGLMVYSLRRLKKTIDELIFHPEVIESKWKKNFNYLSSYYLHYLIENTTKSREELYKIIQEAAFKTNETGDIESFSSVLIDFLKRESITLDLPVIKLADIKDIYLGAVDEVFIRARD